jgi:hypothetical protein
MCCSFLADMLRGKHLWSHYRSIAQSFCRSNYNSGQQHQTSLAEKLKTLASYKPFPIVYEVKPIAEVVHKSASLLENLNLFPLRNDNTNTFKEVSPCHCP